MPRILRPALCTALLLSASHAVAELPGECLQSPSRTAACPHLIYKKSPVDVPMLAVTAGQVVCICLADFELLRTPATSEVQRIDQQMELRRAASQIGLDEQILMELISN